MDPAAKQSGASSIPPRGMFPALRGKKKLCSGISVKMGRTISQNSQRSGIQTCCHLSMLPCLMTFFPFFRMCRCSGRGHELKPRLLTRSRQTSLESAQPSCGQKGSRLEAGSPNLSFLCLGNPTQGMYVFLKYPKT